MSRIYPCIYCTDDLHCTKYTDDNYESWCVLGPCQDETPSNADRIRAMTDEELANMWCTYVDCGECPKRIGCSMNYQDCLRLALEWLKQESEA